MCIMFFAKEVLTMNFAHRPRPAGAPSAPTAAVRDRLRAGPGGRFQ